MCPFGRVKRCLVCTSRAALAYIDVLGTLPALGMTFGTMPLFAVCHSSRYEVGFQAARLTASRWESKPRRPRLRKGPRQWSRRPLGRRIGTEELAPPLEEHRTSVVRATSYLGSLSEYVARKYSQTDHQSSNRHTAVGQFASTIDFEPNAPTKCQLGHAQAAAGRLR